MKNKPFVTGKTPDGHNYVAISLLGATLMDGVKYTDIIKPLLGLLYSSYGLQDHVSDCELMSKRKIRINLVLLGNIDPSEVLAIWDNVLTDYNSSH